MSASYVKALLVIKYTVSDMCCMRKFVSVEAKVYDKHLVNVLMEEDTDGYRFITLSSVKKYLNGDEKRSTILSNVCCIFTLPKFNEFKFFLYQNLI